MKREETKENQKLRGSRGVVYGERGLTNQYKGA
jgi:hypothetical protein